MSSDDAAPPTKERPPLDPVDRRAAVWYWLIVAVPTVALIALTLVGLVLAMAGWYSTWRALPIALILTACAVPWLTRARPTNLSVGRVQPIVMIAIAVATFAYSAENIGQHVFTRQDPGSYLTTGRWLADHGELRPDVSHPVFDEAPEGAYGGPAVYGSGEDHIEFQFSHGASIFMATAYDIAGPRALFAVSAAVGALALLAVYLALTTVSRSPWLAVAGATALGVSLPFLFVTRNTYSEPFVLLVLALALAVLLADGRQLRRSQLALIGGLLGSTMLFRIDGQLYVIGLLLIATFLALRGTRLVDLAVLVGSAAIPAAVGTMDVRMFAGEYASDLSRNIRTLDRATAVALVVLLVASLAFRKSSARWFSRPGNLQLATWFGASIAVLGVFAWQVRPYIPHTTAKRYRVVGGLQRKFGLPEDWTRTYSELSVESIGWYLGVPLVALAIVGFALIGVRLISERNSRFWPAMLLMAVTIPYYLYNTKITPYQLWASRRFVPFILVGFVVAAVWGADRASASKAIRRAARPAVVAVISAALVLPAFAMSWPIRQLSDQRGALGAIQSLCGSLDEDAVVIDIDNGYHSMAIRSWCGVSAGRIAHDDPDALSAALAVGREMCLPVFVVSSNDKKLDLLGDEIAPVDRYSVSNSRRPEQTLDKPPNVYVDQTISWTLGRATQPPGCA